MIAFDCPGCRQSFQVKDEFAGRSTTCPQCGARLVVPAQKEIPMARLANDHRGTQRKEIPEALPAAGTCSQPGPPAANVDTTPDGRHIKGRSSLLLGAGMLLAVGVAAGVLATVFWDKSEHSPDESPKIAGSDGPANADSAPPKESQIPGNKNVGAAPGPSKPDSAPPKEAKGQPGAPQPLKEDTTINGDAKAARLNVPIDGLMPCLLWADAEGSAFLALRGDTGLLRRISFPDCLVTKQKDLGRKFSWMSLSAVGLVLSCPDAEEVWVVDPQTLEVKSKVPIPKLKRAASAPCLSWAVACDQGNFQTQKLYLVNLVQQTIAPAPVPQSGGSNAVGVDNPAMTPDGAYVFTEGDRSRFTPLIYRYSSKGGELGYEDNTGTGFPERGALVSPAGITFSLDSKLVGLASYPWINDESNQVFTMTPYAVDALNKPLCTLDQGNYRSPTGPVFFKPKAVGFDPKGRFVYAQDLSHELVLYLASGVRKKDWTLEKPGVSWPERVNRLGVVVGEAGSRPWQPGDPAGNVQQYLVHPAGNWMVLMTTGSIYAIELPVQPVAIAPWKPAAAKPDDKAPAVSYKGATYKVDDLTVTQWTLPLQGVLPCLLWADAKGTAFFTLRGDNGLVQRISFPDGKLVKKAELDRKFSWMSLSAAGLVLSCSDAQEIWLVEPVSLEVKAKIGVPGLKRASSAPGLPWAVACDQGEPKTQKLYRVDLLKKTASLVDVAGVQRFDIPEFLNPVFPGSVDNPVVTPDGAHVLTDGFIPGATGAKNAAMCSFSWKDDKLQFVDCTELQIPAQSLAGGWTVGSPAGITVSPDSKWVFSHGITPQMGSSGPIFSPVYRVDQLKKPACTLAQGEIVGGTPNIWPGAVGFDPKGEFIYAPVAEKAVFPAVSMHEFAVFSIGGVKKKAYALDLKPGYLPRRVLQYLVHPAGGRVVVLIGGAKDTGPQFAYAVELGGK